VNYSYFIKAFKMLHFRSKLVLLQNIALLIGLGKGCEFHTGGYSGLETARNTFQNNIARWVGNTSQSPPKKLAINNVRVFDGYKLLDPATVVIDGGFIGVDPTGAENIDGAGGVLLPGLLDSHCHPENITHLEDLSRFGVTTGLIAACFSKELCASLQNHRGLADVRLASSRATAPGGVIANFSVTIDPRGENLVHNASQAVQWVGRQVETGADYIKLVSETPGGFDQQTFSALTQASHQLNKTVICHAIDYESTKKAIAARVDQVHHTPLDKALDISLATLLRSNNQISVPTLTKMRAVAHSYPKTRSYSAARDTVRLLNSMSVPILAGSDGGYMAGIPAPVPFGSSVHLEMELLVEAGLSTIQALQAATSLPAKYFGLTDRGVIAPGMRADLLLIDGDPIADIKATRRIKKVWLAGVEFTGATGVFEA
jgi:imidazolonepropionase-like amidohydrolase